MGERSFLCLWLVEVNGVFKIKSKNSKQGKCQIFALILSEKLQTDENSTGNVFHMCKIQVSQDNPWKEFSYQTPVESCN